MARATKSYKSLLGKKVEVFFFDGSKPNKATKRYGTVRDYDGNLILIEYLKDKTKTWIPLRRIVRIKELKEEK